MAKSKPFDPEDMPIIAIDESKTIPFEASRYLDNDETISAYLSASLQEADPNAFLKALAQVAKARGMTQLAKDTGLSRESLYKALQEGAKPRYDTVLKVIGALGLHLTAQPGALAPAR
ncbi:addiction module antidote protein [Pseudomonas putida]